VRRRRGLVAATLVALALALSACTGFPLSGSVNAGLAPGDVVPPEIGFLPDKPQPGASAEQIVDGFIRAGSGPDNNFATARLYLAPKIRDTWNPDAGVTVDVLADRKTAVQSEGRISLTLTTQATVDADGAYATSDGGSTTLPFTLAKVSGQWRITSAPDGIVLDADQFPSVYHSYSVMYFDPTWHYLVPDLRWFPSTNLSTRIVKALVSGKPSPWLLQSVVSAFPANVTLDHASVPVVAGTAQVELAGAVLSLEPATLDRMQTQLEASLQSAGISDVAMSYGGTSITASAVSTTSTRIDARALVVTDKGLGFLNGADLEPISGLSDAVMAASPAAVQVAANQSFAAVRSATGAVVRAQDDKRVVPVDARAGLIDPTLDPQGYIWSVPANAPSALTARAANGQPVTVAVGATWAGASHITAMSLSRDGTRLAALVTSGGQSVAWVAGVVRNADGVPQSLGEAYPLAQLPGAPTAVSWLDDSTVGIIAADGSNLVEIEQPIGGPPSETNAPDDAVTVAGSTLTTIRVLTRDGALFNKRGSNWEQAASSIRILAVQQGSPQ
jgi:hypothetical protein